MKKELKTGLIAAGAAAAAAAAAGYYFYGSKNAKKHRQVAAKWAGDMKKEVMKEAGRLKDLDAQDFANIVDTVASTYRGVSAIKRSDIERAANELKANWKKVQKEARTGVKKAVKKVVQKAQAEAKKGA